MSPARPTVLIAGGGVAGLEALLMVRRLLGRRVRAVVLAPEPEFTYRQYAVAEPFGYGEVARFDLGDLVSKAGGRLRQDALASVDASAKIAFTTAGAEIHFDALVIAVGAESANGLPGAITYRGPASNRDVHQAILAIDRGEISRLAFAVPAPCHWSLPLYELAIMAATHLADIGDGSEAIDLITAEKEPLDVFGAGASQRLRAELDRVGVRLHTGVAPARVAAGGLTLMDGSVVQCDRAFALPRLEVSPLDGVAQGPHGSISTDSRMRVAGCPDVYAVGDASWFPIKQGGLAAQQADVAATAIAAGIDSGLEDAPFRPELRAALLTADGPIYLKAGAGEAGAVSDAPLWWPPGKVAGRLLTPFIADQARESNQPLPALIDLEPASPGEVEDHREATELAFTAANVNARSGDYETALRWLDVADRLDLVLPPEYVLRRVQWQRELQPTARAV
jgi:sulfide:quinone oxidoreductase